MQGDGRVRLAFANPRGRVHRHSNAHRVEKSRGTNVRDPPSDKISCVVVEIRVGPAPLGPHIDCHTFEAPVLNVVPRHHEHDDATEEVEALNARRPVVGWAADVDKDICFVQSFPRRLQ